MFNEHSRRQFCRAAGLGALSALLPGCATMQKEASERSKPNILFLFTDDQRFNDINALNNPQVITPNMDRLVRNGFSFNKCHIMGSMNGAVCMPSRAMLMSGRNLFHLQNQGQQIPEEHITMPQRFRMAGYQTFGTGKWHNGKASYARSFTDGASIFFGGMADHLHVPVHDFDPSGEYPNSKRYIETTFSTELFCGAAIDFLQRHDTSRPFFAYVSFTSPHDPRMAPKDYAGMYDPASIELPPNFLPQHPFNNGWMRGRDEMLAPHPRTPENTREQIAAYYAMTTHLDAQFGKILQTLEESGQMDNTIIVFAGDNGLAVGQHGLMGKQNLYDCSIRVPLVLCGAGIPQGQSDAYCYLHDIFPSLCDRTGLSIPETVESRSFNPLLAGQKEPVRNNLYGAYEAFQRMVKDERWKMIRYYVDGKSTMQMFDLENDPWEMNDLAANPGQAQRIHSMNRLLKEWMVRLDDPHDMGSSEWVM